MLKSVVMTVALLASNFAFAAPDTKPAENGRGVQSAQSAKPAKPAKAARTARYHRLDKRRCCEPRRSCRPAQASS
jgi:hypothetical protein